MKAELWIHNGRSVLTATAQSVCPARLQPPPSTHHPPSTHPTPAPPQGQLARGRPYERTCSPPSQKFPLWPLPALGRISLTCPRLASSPSIHLSEALPTLMSRGFCPCWSAEVSLFLTHIHMRACAHTHTHTHTHTSDGTFKERGEVSRESDGEWGATEIQINGGAPKREDALRPPQGSKFLAGSGTARVFGLNVRRWNQIACVPAQFCHLLVV